MFTEQERLQFMFNLTRQYQNIAFDEINTCFYQPDKNTLCILTKDEIQGQYTQSG